MARRRWCLVSNCFRKCLASSEKDILAMPHAIASEEYANPYKNYCLLPAFCKPVNVIMSLACHSTVFWITLLYHSWGRPVWQDCCRMVIVLWQVCNFNLQACHSQGPVYPTKKNHATGLEHIHVICCYGDH